MHACIEMLIVHVHLNAPARDEYSTAENLGMTNLVS